jgi:GT2 family glycosyltransferase
MTAKSIAVLITSHNRRDMTVACLAALRCQSLPDGFGYIVYLVDAGSTDGTVSVIENEFPEVVLIEKDASVFWNEGMRIAFEQAMQAGHDFYLWLNDDTKLYPNAIAGLLDVYHEAKNRGQEAIVIGSMCDPETGHRTYGGLRSKSKWRPISFAPVVPAAVAQECDTFDGNCVLLPNTAVEMVGGLDSKFRHAMGDTDYGLRAKKRGIPMLVAPGYAGVCRRNPPPVWSDPDTPVLNRLKSLCEPKGLPPAQWLFFIRRHGGILWPLYWFKFIQRVFFPRSWIKSGGRGV